MFLKGFFSKLTAKYWTIGFTERKPVEDLRFSDIKWVKCPKGEWFADPFILDYDDNTITLLVENVIHPDPIGKIAKLVIDRKNLKIVSKTIVLSLSTHLSFPVIVHKEDGTYFYPENSASGELNVYKLNSDATSCDMLCTLVKAPLTDAIIFEHEGKYIMTATIEPDSNGNHMQIYSSEEEFGNYTFIRDIYLDNNTARNAGYTLKKSSGLYYKISQENDFPVYGHGMVFYEVTPDMKYMREINRIQPGKGFVGVHTMNPYRNLIVWDGKKYRYPAIALFIEKLSKKAKLLIR